jgi:glycolate oxidase subunit GlcD
VNNLVNNLSAIVGQENVLSEPDELLVYECDGLPQHKHRPRAVVFPSSTEQTSAVMRELAKAKVPFTPRGAGTGLSGGALALNEGVVIELARMRKILRIDAVNRLAVVQPGVVNLHVSRAVAPFGLYYVPDPSSQPTCTIGGNIAESAGGIHCLKYGTTADHVIGCRVVLAGGEVVDLGGAGIDVPGYDLLGTFIGSEGTFGIATEATLRLVTSPPAVRTLLAEFVEVNDASHAVSAIIAAGVMPAALEMMDHEIIKAVEASVFAAGLPPDAGAALIIELDGIEAGIDDEAARVTDICLEYGARNCRRARDEAERKKLWAARKGAFGAIGRISPDSMIQDAVVPRSRLPEVLGAAYEIAARYQLKIANVFHAGDGNLHPLICFDSRFPEQVKRVKEAGRELMEVCVKAGGTITGEHGVGLDKRELLPLVFSDADMNAMLSVRAAFDPIGLCNPGKIIPMLRGCGEGRAIETRDGETERRGDRELEGLNQVKTKGKEEIDSRQHPKSIIVDSTRLLAGIVGEANVSHDLSTDQSPLVVTPGSIEEISEVMKVVSRERAAVIPAGGRTWLTAQRASPKASLLVSTARLNKILEHEPADLIAVAQAGVRLQVFNEQLALNGQWLPLDPPDDGRATLGGIIATGLGGAQQFGYGRPRGSVIGMKVVLADGSIIKVGGRVVKNVAGYDLCKLFTGSYGTLGIITELNFKLRPRPQRESTVVATGRPFDLIAVGRSVLDARLFPVAVELVSSGFASRLGMTTDQDSAVLLVRFAGNEKGVAYQVQSALTSLGKSDGVRETDVISEDAGVWRALANVPIGEKQGWRASVLPSELGRFVAGVSELYGQSFDLLLWQVSIGCGRMRMMENSEHGGETSKLIDQLRQATSSAGGVFVIDGLTKEIESSVSERRPEVELAMRIKQQLDPQGVFQPAPLSVSL